MFLRWHLIQMSVHLRYTRKQGTRTVFCSGRNSFLADFRVRCANLWRPCCSIFKRWLPKSNGSRPSNPLTETVYINCFPSLVDVGRNQTPTYQSSAYNLVQKLSHVCILVSTKIMVRLKMPESLKPIIMSVMHVQHRRAYHTAAGHR